jgi:hypothetical protein
MIRDADGEMASHSVEVRVDVRAVSMSDTEHNEWRRNQRTEAFDLAEVDEDGYGIIEIWHGGYRLRQNIDFTFRAADGSNTTSWEAIGTYDIIITFIGNYTGEIEAKFIIEASWVVATIIAGGAVALVGAGVGIFVISRVRYKRRKYGMKRHVRTFLDSFDSDIATV